VEYSECRKHRKKRKLSPRWESNPWSSVHWSSITNHSWVISGSALPSGWQYTISRKLYLRWNHVCVQVNTGHIIRWVVPIKVTWINACEADVNNVTNKPMFFGVPLCNIVGWQFDKTICNQHEQSGSWTL